MSLASLRLRLRSLPPRHRRPRGHRGRDPYIRELLEAEANARPCPEVSVCMRMALNKAAKIRRRRAEAEEAAKLALLGQGPAVAAEPGAPLPAQPAPLRRGSDGVLRPQPGAQPTKYCAPGSKALGCPLPR